MTQTKKTNTPTASKPTTDGKERCGWGARGGDLMMAYHDTEWGVPVHDDQKQFEFLTLESAQAGLSWLVVLRKREAYRRAFADFDPEKVARFTAKRIEKLIADPGIIRNRLKITAAITNAQKFLEVQEEFGTFDKYIWSFVGGQAHPESACEHEARAGHVERIRRAEQRSQAARLQVRRQHDRVRTHASRRHGQRPSRDVLSAQALCAAEMSLPPTVRAARFSRAAVAGMR